MCRPGEVDQVIDGTGKCVLPGISREYVVLAFGLFFNYVSVCLIILIQKRLRIS